MVYKSYDDSGYYMYELEGFDFQVASCFSSYY